ncbi:hypothetical protein NFI96_030675, partial [Prochilodus magdalenae]
QYATPVSVPAHGFSSELATSPDQYATPVSVPAHGFSSELATSPVVSIRTPSDDPCYNYTSLDQPWRATNATELQICDSNFIWTGWYRLLYYGMNIRMPESCVNVSTCGTDAPLWLNGSHPQIQDGIVTRGVCGISGKKLFVSNHSLYTAGAQTNTSFDPCNVYSVLDQSWRSVYVKIRSYDDTLVEWSGWYRLKLQGKNAQIPESDWCVSYMTCGGYTPLLLGGSHPLPQDGIATRDIYGSYGYVIDSRQCNSQRSNPIQVKACPGNYYVYKLIKPAVSLPVPSYCAVVSFRTPSYDPCYLHTSLDQPWRATNATGLQICDSDFIWTGWYRLLYYGMNIRMPESCVTRSTCGTNIPLWLNGTHPHIQDGIVTRRVCGRSGSDCCKYRSTPIQVKACPGDYYVYEFVDPSFCNSTYCAGILLLLSTFYQSSCAQTNTSFDPCNVYSVLDQSRRSVYMNIRSYDDTLVEWSGWYRLKLQGKSAQIPESDWCDGIVTRDIYGSYGYVIDSRQCNSQRSNPIQVKACSGNYYVYKLVKPAVSLPVPSYCAVALNTNYDPCNNYTSLNQPWRAINETGGSNCDSNVIWTGWYRLQYNGMNIRMPESCVNRSRCGTNITLWLNGSHPQIEDGIVTRRVCGKSGSDCCYYTSFPIQVKACTGDYYVYEFVKPSMWCSAAYCAGKSISDYKL